MMIKRTILALAAAGVGISGAFGQATAEKKDATVKSEKGWIQLFNGKDLTGWTPKFSGHKAGVNYKDTFKVKDGLLVVDYSNWDKFAGEFGHLFYNKEFGHYILRAEYRFVGDQVKGGPGWANANNGFMIHGQKPEDMKLDQDFPNSIEVQLLGDLGGGKRGTLNICTPGTQLEVNGKLTKAHVINAKGPAFPKGEWVTVEVEVHGSEVIRHKCGGKTVIEYNKPQRDDGTLLEKGTISIQAETAPIEFRKIELKELKK